MKHSIVFLIFLTCFLLACSSENIPTNNNDDDIQQPTTDDDPTDEPTNEPRSTNDDEPSNDPSNNLDDCETKKYDLDVTLYCEKYREDGSLETRKDDKGATWTYYEDGYSVKTYEVESFGFELLSETRKFLYEYYQSGRRSKYVSYYKFTSARHKFLIKSITKFLDTDGNNKCELRTYTAELDSTETITYYLQNGRTVCTDTSQAEWRLLV